MRYPSPFLRQTKLMYVLMNGNIAIPFLNSIPPHLQDFTFYHLEQRWIPPHEEFECHLLR